MKVFISWSGIQSKQCAEILRDWIKCSLQASEPWISSKDIEKGTLWFNEISDQLADTSVGIVCLTKRNKDKPWILFEAGALAKGLSANRVCTLLVDLKPSDLDSPLSQFNHTIPDKENMKALLTTINSELGEGALEDRILDQVFETYWPKFETQFSQIETPSSESDDSAPARSNDDILEEILYTTRGMDKRIRKLERNKPRFSEYAEKRELDRLIERMLSNGANPVEVVTELKDFAPILHLEKRAEELWRRRLDNEITDRSNDT